MDSLAGRVVETEHGPYRVIGGVRWSDAYVELEAVNPPELGQPYRKTVRRTDQLMKSLGIVPASEPEPAGRVVHCKAEAYDVYIGRLPGGELGWGNPYSHKADSAAEHIVPTREDAVAAYRAWMEARLESGEEGLAELIAGLYGKTLGCWCAPKACHGDVLLDLATRLTSSPG